MLDTDLIDLLIDELENPDNGKFEAYSPVIVNVLRDVKRVF